MTTEAQKKGATVTVPSEREIRVEREFEAPRELVFKAMTDPELVPQWWGPHDTKTVVEVMEPRAGGLWRFLTEDCEGNEANFRGVYREVTAPARVVQTWEWEGLPGHVSIETGILEELDGDRTRFVGLTLFHTQEERDGMLNSGMEKGMNETYERLDALLAAGS